MNPKLKGALNSAPVKNAVNAALLSFSAAWHDPAKYNLHTWVGVLGVLEMIGTAVVVREVIVYLPKALKWSDTGAVQP